MHGFDGGTRQRCEIVTPHARQDGRGGIYDQLGGGFHRYSVDAQWLVPHFEKMLYDNAQLVRVYLQAYHVTGEPLVRRIVDRNARLRACAR